MNIVYQKFSTLLFKKPFVIVYDIGGTNGNAGLFGYQKDQVIPIVIIQYKSQTFSNLYDLIIDFQQYLIDHYQLKDPVSIVIAGAGFVKTDRTALFFTNLKFIFEIKILKERCLFKVPIILMNDFEVIWDGISLIDQRMIRLINGSLIQDNKAAGIIGAGTGLGKSIISFSSTSKQYTVLPSEGGHQVTALITDQEFALMNFIIKQEPDISVVTWEHLLSGNGVSRIYQFFLSQIDPNAVGSAHHSLSPHPDKIFQEQTRDPLCLKTYILYLTLYARFIREFAIEILPFGGLYIAGGIAIHNQDMFYSEIFMKEYSSHQRYSTLLKEIPLYLITDYNVSLYGAAMIGFKYLNRK